MQHGGKDTKREFNTFYHVELMEELAKYYEVDDAKYVEEFWHGLNVVGDVVPSGRWEAVEKDAEITVQQLLQDSAQLRQKIQNLVTKNGHSKHTKVLWEDTVREVQKGFCVGPIYDEDEVTKFVQATSGSPL